MTLRFPFIALFTAAILLILFFGCLSCAFGMEIVPDLSRRSERVSVSGQNGLAFSREAVDGPITVIGTVVFGADWDLDKEAEIWLVGLSRLMNEASLGVAVTLSQVDSGWFPVWKIQLRSRQADGVGCTDLLIAMPEAGHAYTSTLSYDPRSGGCAVHIVDETTDKVIYSGGFTLPIGSSRLFPVAGAIGVSEDAYVTVRSMDVYPTYVPVGVKLQATPESRPTASLVGSFERTEPLLIHIDTPGALPEGEYHLRIVHHDTDEVRELGPVQAIAPRMSFVYPLTELPGRATLTLEYFSEGHRWLSSGTELSIGWLDVEFGDPEADEQKDKLNLRMRVRSDASVRGVPLKVTASLLQTARDPQTRQLQTIEHPPVVVFEDRVDADPETRQIPLSVELPEGRRLGVWAMTLRVESDSSIDLRRFGTDVHFALTPSTKEVLASLERRVDHGPPRISLDEEARLRAIATARPRRIIYNNDGDDARAPSAPRTMENFLDTRITPLVGSQVDTIIYDTTAGTFGGFSHATGIGEIFTTREGVFRNNITGDLIRRGTDPLQMVVNFARQNGIEIFWAMRMNDTHDASTEPMFSQFKKENPDMIFGSSTRRPPYGAWSGVDYAEPLVRELAFRYIEEVAENYDVDGIFLDFFRHPVFFKRVAWGEPISDSDLDAMTGLVRRIRERLRELGALRGRPFLLAVRVPDSAEYRRAVGLDLERWLADGLVDMFMPGGYFRLDRWEKSVELGDRYGVPVYPSLDESRVGGLINPSANDPARRSLEAYRGRAMNAWQAGAGGIHLFNMFAPKHPMLREIGSPETLLGKEKVYFVSVRGESGAANPNTRVGEAKNFFRTPILTPDSPLVLWSDTSTELMVDVGEDMEAARSIGLQPVITLQLHTAGVPQAKGLEVRFNGHLLGEPQVGSSYLEYVVDPDWVCRGPNRVELRAHLESEQSLHLRWAGPAMAANALGITELDVTTPDSHSLGLRIRAEASGEAVVGSVLIRLPNKGDVDPIPPGFEVIHGGYRYPKGWSAPGFRFNGPFDEEPDDEKVFAITLPMVGAKPDEYTLRVYVTNRPALGTYYDDSRLVQFRIDEQGAVRLPVWDLYDVQLWVRYE